MSYAKQVKNGQQNGPTQRGTFLKEGREANVSLPVLYGEPAEGSSGYNAINSSRMLEGTVGGEKFVSTISLRRSLV